MVKSAESTSRSITMHRVKRLGWSVVATLAYAAVMLVLDVLGRDVVDGFGVRREDLRA